MGIVYYMMRFSEVSQIELVELIHSPITKHDLSYVKQKTPDSVTWMQLAFTKVIKCNCLIIVNILTIRQMQSFVVK